MKAVVLIGSVLMFAQGAFASAPATCVAHVLKNGGQKIESPDAVSVESKDDKSVVLKSRGVVVEFSSASGKVDITVLRGEEVLSSAHGSLDDLALEVSIGNNESIFASCLAAPPAPQQNPGRSEF